MTEAIIKALIPEATKELCDQLIAAHNKALEPMENSITQLTTERDGLKTQLETAHGEIQSYKELDIEGVKQKAADWETKYNTDTAALKAQMEALSYAQVVKDSIAPYQFSSESAKRAFVGDLTAKKLPLQEGKLLGLEDFHKQYAASDPGAFVSAEEEQRPVFSSGTGGGILPAQSSALSAIRAAAGLKTEEK